MDVAHVLLSQMERQHLAANAALELRADPVIQIRPVVGIVNVVPERLIAGQSFEAEWTLEDFLVQVNLQVGVEI